MDEETRKMLERLFPGQDVDKMEILDGKSYEQISISARYYIQKNQLFVEADTNAVSYDSFIPGYFKILEVAKTEPHGIYDKRNRYLALITWKEFENEEYDLEFREQVRINPFVYQVNSRRFLRNLNGKDVRLNRYGSPELCLHNFELLVNKEIWVENVLRTKNNQGQDVYEIIWDFHRSH